MAQGQGNFGNPEQHRKAGSMSSGGSHEHHVEAGKKGAAAQSTEDKAKGGRNSHANQNTTNS
jgi:hypothetical protein